MLFIFEYNGRLIMKSESRMCEEVEVYFKALFVGFEEYHERFLLRKLARQAKFKAGISLH